MINFILDEGPGSIDGKPGGTALSQEQVFGKGEKCLRA
jgi:hypothetical protein